MHFDIYFDIRGPAGTLRNVPNKHNPVEAETMTELLPGKKSYCAGAAMIAFGAIGFFLGLLEAQQAAGHVLQGAAVIALRLGIAKS